MTWVSQQVVKRNAKHYRHLSAANSPPCLEKLMLTTKARRKHRSPVNLEAYMGAKEAALATAQWPVDV